MHFTKANNFRSRMNTRLAAYALAICTAAFATAPVATTKAAIVSSGPVNLAVPDTLDGIYINFATGQTDVQEFPGFDFNPYAANGNLLFYWGSVGSINYGVAATTNGPYLLLQPGSTIGPDSIFSKVANGSHNETAAFQAGVNGYLGVKFFDDVTFNEEYGYVHFQTTGATGFPATILDYAYDNTGAAITVNAVPEPTTTAALGLGALSLGAAGVRRWRRSQQAAA